MSFKTILIDINLIIYCQIEQVLSNLAWFLSKNRLQFGAKIRSFLYIMLNCSKLTGTTHLMPYTVGKRRFIAFQRGMSLPVSIFFHIMSLLLICEGPFITWTFGTRTFYHRTFYHKLRSFQTHPSVSTKRFT